jgi:hypothetical protein
MGRLYASMIPLPQEFGRYCYDAVRGTAGLHTRGQS